MKQRNWICFFLFMAVGVLTPGRGQAQTIRKAGVVTDDDFTVEELVQDIFVKGGCENTFNIRGIGDERSVGYFENAGDVLGIERGIIFSTGRISNAEGPNSTYDRSTDFQNLEGDPDLQEAATSRVQDVAGFEFDFIPLDSVITFRYVFASEEYCEYVGSKFNDVFGFFVSGPGIRGPFSDNGVNVALLPETDEYVSINAVNHLSNTEYYIPNPHSREIRQCEGVTEGDYPFREFIEFDGFTKVLTATLRLIPCETYQLKLVVGDVGVFDGEPDGKWDSAVFLEAESFNVGGAVELLAESTIGRDTIEEGCDYGSFLVRRLDTTRLDQPISVGLRVGAGSTAWEGVDFEPLPKQVIIPEGEASVRFPIELIIDDEFEPVEEIILELDFPCECFSDAAYIAILDPPPMETALRDLQICNGETVSLEVQARGGVPGYTYLWSNGSTDSVLVLSPESDSRYQLTLTDACGRELIETVDISLRTPPTLTYGGLQQACIGATATFNLQFTGTPPFAFTWALDGVEQGSFSGITENRFPLRVSEEGEIEITAFNDATCSGKATGLAELRYYRLQSITDVESPSCNGLSDGQIQMTLAGGAEPYTFEWSDGQTGNPVKVAAGSYSVTITDTRGCITQANMQVNEPAALEPITFDCREFTSGFIAYSASGGTPPYTYSVDGGPFRDVSLFNELSPGQSYTLRIRDARACNLIQDFVMPATYDKMVTLDETLLLELGDVVTLRPSLSIPTSLVESLLWFPDTRLSCSDCLHPQLTALASETITLQVQDRFGCSGTASIRVKIDQEPGLFVPSAFSPDGNGANDRLQIFADDRQVREVLSFQVFSRWGAVLYEARNFAPNSPAQGWDGRFQGTLLDAGPYVYLVEVELVDGTTRQFRGVTHLMR